MQSNNTTVGVPRGTPTDHSHLMQTLSAMMAQLNALQTLVRDNAADGGSPADSVPDINAIRNGLATLEQMAAEMLYEVRAVSDDEPLADLPGVPLAEALSRAVEEAAESLGLSSRIVFSGDQRPLSSDGERLLYRIAREALQQVQQHTGARRLRFSLNYGRDEVLLSIEDDGVAPAQTELSFFTRDQLPAPPFTPGDVEARFITSGLSFASLRNRVEHLGGSLEITTNLEQGTEVQARIPYVHHAHDLGTQFIAPRLTAPTAATSAIASTERIRVLLVDNQSVTRAGLRRLLESYSDLQVIGEAADAIQAASEMAELGPQVVIIDAQLPNGQSLEALRQVKLLNPDTHVLFLSTINREEYLYEALRAGASGYVLKDIAPDDLAQAVRTVAHGEVLVQPEIAGRLISRFGRQGRGSYPSEALTVREQEVLRLLARGLRNKEIAARLYVSERTVNFHLANIYQKLNVSGRTEALSKAHEQGLITA